MSFKCSIGLHSWDGCKCDKCGKVRQEQHSWSGCKCQKCDRTREVSEEQHLWNGCVCSKCSATRDTEHSWIENSCSKCHKTKSIQYATDLVNKNKHKEAIEILEQIEQANSQSAHFYFLIGFSYSQYGGQNFNDNDLVLPWIRKSVDALNKSLKLEREFGGLSSKQYEIASEAALHGERVIELHSPSLPEERRRYIYADYNVLAESELYNITNLSGGKSPLEMMNMLNKNISLSQTKAAEKMLVKHNLSKGQMLAIEQEGREKKWPAR